MILKIIYVKYLQKDRCDAATHYQCVVICNNNVNDDIYPHELPNPSWDEPSNLLIFTTDTHHHSIRYQASERRALFSPCYICQKFAQDKLAAYLVWGRWTTGKMVTIMFPIQDQTGQLQKRHYLRVLRKLSKWQLKLTMN